MTTINEEVDFIGPGHKRIYGSNRRGYWTPELATWRDSDGFSNIMDLQAYSYLSGIKVTGVKVNASPIVCITKSNMGESDVLVEFTGSIGVPSGTITTGDVTITGYEEFYQYNQKMFRRLYVTGGDEFKYSFTIPAYTPLGTTFEIPTKRCYQVSGITATPQNANEPLTNLGFYALADNGSKLLYSMNWNKTFDNLKQIMYGYFGHPDKCPRCNGSGYVGDTGNSCDQCNFYKYDGPNAQSFQIIDKGKHYGLVQDSGETDKTFRNKIWAMEWHVIPTQKSIQTYFAHFARITTGEVVISNEDRSSGPTGIERRVVIRLPQVIPLSLFDNTDHFWLKMVEKVRPGAIEIDFSFLTQAFTGAWWSEEVTSYQSSGYTDGIFTGSIANNIAQYGFYEPFSYDNFTTPAHGWNAQWGDDWHFFNLLPTGFHDSGDDGHSGYMNLSGNEWTGASGALVGEAWLKWTFPSENNGVGGIWTTGGGESGVVHSDFYSLASGTFLWDNFWASGIGGIQY